MTNHDLPETSEAPEGAGPTIYTAVDSDGKIWHTTDAGAKHWFSTAVSCVESGGHFSEPVWLVWTQRGVNRMVYYTESDAVLAMVGLAADPAAGGA
jgi:hypothetical protein